MPVTPKGIVSPNAADPYDLTVDLAAMAASIDDAIETGGILRKGTATERGDLEGVENGTIWQDTDGIKMLWRYDSTVSGGWTPAITRWRGTTAQRTAFLSNAPAGFQWYDTSLNRAYVKRGTAWVVESGAQILSGQVTLGTTISNVTFPAGYFSAAPYVVLTVSSGVGSAVGRVPMVTARSATGFSARLDSGSANVAWVAVNNL